MAAGRKPGASGGGGVPAAVDRRAPTVDPRAPTKASLRPGAPPRERSRKVPEPGDFSPDAPTRIMPPTPSLEERPEGASVYNPNAPTRAMNLGGLPDLDDPFAARATEVELPSFSSEEAAGSAFDDDDDGARVDLRPPPRPRAAPEVVEISLSDIDPLSEPDALPPLGDDDSDEDTHDTVVNMPLPSSLRAGAVSVPPKGPARPPPKPPLPSPTVVERRSYSPAALFDEDPGSVTDPHREEAPDPVAFYAAPGDLDASPSSAFEDPPLPSVERDDAVGDGAPVLEEPPAREGASERTAARPSLASQPSGAPAPPVVAAPAPPGSDDGADDVAGERRPVAEAAGESAPAAPSPPPAAAVDEAAPWEEPSLVDEEADGEDRTVAPEVEDGAEDVLPPLLHKWKVVPTAIRELDKAPPPAPAGFAGEGRAKALQTVLWSPEDEAAARAQQASGQRTQNPFWAPTDAAALEDDPLESTEAAAPSDPRMAAAAYIHDAVAYLRSLSHFAAHLDDEVRHEFEGRVLGANEKLRRALAVLHSALDDAPDDAPGEALDDAPEEDER